MLACSQRWTVGKLQVLVLALKSGDSKVAGAHEVFSPLVTASQFTECASAVQVEQQSQGWSGNLTLCCSVPPEAPGESMSLEE